jgi:hypothetical protein
VINHLSFEGLRSAVRTTRDVLPTLLANQAQNYFVSSFDKQGFDGAKWQEVQRRIEGTPAYKYPKTKDLGRRTRWILIGKGSTKLRRAVNNSVRLKTWPLVQLIVDLPYAKAQNEGNPARNLPKRQYMGQTEELTRMQRELVKRELDKNIKG